MTATTHSGTDWWWRTGIVIAFAIVCVGGVLFGLKPIPQKVSYHDFADARSVHGIPNAQNVLSNLPFLLVAILGLEWLRRPDAVVEPSLRPAYLTLFLGLGATAFGSAYYHWAPTAGTLFWDRLPIAVAFMGLFAAFIGERLGPAIGCRLLLPLVAFGAASVIYWRIFDDLRLYAIAQFFPLLAIPLIAALFPSRYTRGGDIFLALGCYVIAKVLEELDGPVFDHLHLVSGHVLKHLAAALGAYLVVRMLLLRRPMTDAPPAQRP